MPTSSMQAAAALAADPSSILDMEYFVRHRTTYRYLQDVSHSWHLAHLNLRTTPTQTVHGGGITLSLETSSRVARLDYFENPCEWFSIDRPHNHLEVLAESRVTVDPAPERVSSDSLPWEEVRALLESPQDDEARDAVQFQFDSPLSRFHSDIASYGSTSFPPNRPLLAGAMELMNRIHKDFRYDTTVTDVTTPVDRVFEIRAGVCQDLAHVGIAAMRAIGLAAPLCLRLFADRTAQRQATASGCRRQSRLVQRVGTTFWLGGP